MYKSQSVSLTRSVVRIKAKNTDFDAYAKRLDALSFSCNGHLCFLLLGNFRRESFFFVIHRLKVNCKVTSLSESLAASAKLHRSDCEYVIALLSYNLLVWLRK